MKILVLAFLGFISLSSFAQTTTSGIVFFEGEWKEILTKAKAEDKLIFLDAYTDWCGPCKKMNKEVFSDQKVGDFYNEQFINVKMNMEKGEGQRLAIKYNVDKYPSLLFIDSNGKSVHQVVGYHPVPKFLNLGKTAANPQLRLASLNTRYLRGDRKPDFLRNYAMARLAVADGSHIKIAEEYLRTQRDWGTPQNIQFIFTFASDADSKMFDYIIANKGVFERVFGKQSVEAKIQQLIYSKLSQVGGDDASFAQVERLYAKVYPKKAAELTSRFKMAYFRQQQDADKYAEAAIDHYSKYEPTHADEINDVAWTFYEVVDNPQMLKRAVKWAKKSIKMDNTYFNTDTLAALYAKLGKKSKARKTALKAIALAREEGEDYSETQQLLQELNAK